MDLTVEYRGKDVDLVAVERVLAGIPTKLTPAEHSYAYRLLLESFDKKPPEMTWKCGSAGHISDERYAKAAQGLGKTAKEVAAYVSTLRRRMRQGGPGYGERRASHGERRASCRSGHEFTPENTRSGPNGTRRCRQCDRAAGRRYAAKRRKEKADGLGRD